MLAAVTAGVTSSAVRVPPAAETSPAAVEAFRRMAAASHVEAARTSAADSLGFVTTAKQMYATRVRWPSRGVRKAVARESPGRPSPEFAPLKT